MFYRVFGLNVKSDYCLMGAYEVTELDNIDVEICEVPYNSKAMDTGLQGDGGRTKYSHFDMKETIIHLPDYLYFRIVNGNRIEYCIMNQDDELDISQKMLCLCMPTILLQRNMTLLHGSGILVNDRVLMISGESGSGKSSLAQEIMQRNHQQLTDDIIAVEEINGEFMVHPSFPVRKLCVDQVEKYHLDKTKLFKMPDDGREKYGLPLGDACCKNDKPIGAMVIITPCDVEEPQLVEITGADKLKYLTANFFREDFYEQVPFTPAIMMRTIKMANQLPLYFMRRPKTGMTVKQQADLIGNIL